MDYSWGNRFKVRVNYVVVVLLIVFVQTLPAFHPVLRYFAPDIVLAVSLAWALRRPDAITPILVGVVTFALDLILHRPPSLWTIVVIFAIVFVQGRGEQLRYSFYSVEWGLVAAVIIAVFVAYQTLLFVTLSGLQPVTLTAAQAASTILLYPLVTTVTARVFGLRLSEEPDTPKKGRRT